MSKLNVETLMNDNMPYFQVEHSVKKEELDELGHVSNTVYVKWLDSVTRLHNTELGLDQHVLIENDSVFVIQKHLLTYKKPAFEKDLLEIKTRIISYSAFKHLREYQISSKADGGLIFSAETVLVNVSFTSGKLKRMPDVYFDRFREMGSLEHK